LAAVTNRDSSTFNFVLRILKVDSMLSKTDNILRNYIYFLLFLTYKTLLIIFFI
jgi:hypothetical protein